MIKCPKCQEEIGSMLMHYRPSKPASESERTAAGPLDAAACSPSFAGYKPESWSMLKDSIYAAQDAIRAGIENTQELLADHDARLGRTTRSNRYTGERLESEIRQMQAALDGLQKPNGCSCGERSQMAPDGVRRQVDLSPENAKEHPTAEAP